jgi:hypothetical protein
LLRQDTLVPSCTLNGFLAALACVPASAVRADALAFYGCFPMAGLNANNLIVNTLLKVLCHAKRINALLRLPSML